MNFARVTLTFLCQTGDLGYTGEEEYSHSHGLTQPQQEGQTDRQTDRQTAQFHYREGHHHQQSAVKMQLSVVSTERELTTRRAVMVRASATV